MSAEEDRAAIRRFADKLATPEGRRSLLAEVVDYFFTESMKLPREPASPLGEEKPKPAATSEPIVVEASKVEVEGVTTK